jgi:hypothetical protein
MIRGYEFHSIIQNVFGDVKGLGVSEQLQTCCPRCQEEQGLSYPDGKYNLEINTAKRQFHCWRCDNPRFSGSLKRLIRLYGSQTDYDLYKSYSLSFQEYDFDYESEEIESVQIHLPEEMILFSKMEEGNPEHFEAYNYLLLERKISRDIMFKYKLGFCTTGKYAKSIIIPSYDTKGEINYFVSRNYDPNNKKKNKYKNPPVDKDKIIFNEGLVNWDSTLCIVEGVFEMLSFPINTIPLLGKTLSSTLFLKLQELKPDVIVLLDPDAYKNAVELYYTLHTIYVDCEERVKLVKIPNEKDLDDLRKNKGIDEVIKSLYSARGLITDDYFINKLEKLYNGTRRYNSYTKYFKWESTSARNFV